MLSQSALTVLVLLYKNHCQESRDQLFNLLYQCCFKGILSKSRYNKFKHIYSLQSNLIYTLPGGFFLFSWAKFIILMFLVIENHTSLTSMTLKPPQWKDVRK